ncbi:SDR family NAD(P)-dependent oxidoreductase [Chloroflexota bacterium]
MKNPNTQMKDRTAIIVGGGRGLGRSSSLILAEAGASVVVVDIDDGRATSVANEIHLMGRRSLAVVADVTDSKQINKVVDEVLKEFSHIDVLVNIIGMARWISALDMTEDIWDDQLNLNLKYVWLTSRAVAKVMIEQSRKGSIVNIASLDGVAASPMHAAYGAAKSGLIGLTRSLAIEWASYQIRVNAIAPGAIMTPRVVEILKNKPEQEEAQRLDIPLGRWGEPEDIAGIVLGLASDLFSYVTGQTLIADGGIFLNPFRATYSREGAHS